MDDKFIIMDLEDERSKKVAEVLGNKTCKKIIDYLSETKEASEKDISDALGVPINTVEYNLKKLLNAGLVKKTKNFFWSKRGKKIPMYQLAKKHIVISPTKKKPTRTVLKTIIPIIAVLAVANLILLSYLFPPETQIEDEMNRFKSLDELKSFLEDNTVSDGYYGEVMDMARGGVFSVAKEAASAVGSGGASEYSETNIQVEGVDEADIIKNDGKYIYTVTGNKVVIVEAYPANRMEVLSEIEFENEYVAGIFINDDKLVVLSTVYGPVLYEGEVRCMAIDCVPPSSEPVTNIRIYGVSDREYPELEDTIKVTGNYHNSRMIDEYVYIINNQYIYDRGVLPVVEENGVVDVVEAREIYYSDIKDTSFQYTIILAVDIDTGEASEKTLLTGRAQNIYVSQDNIYTTYTKHPRWYYPAEMVEEGKIKEQEKTIINKFSIDESDISYVATGEVPGHVLNQFSMDEYEDNFRIATTLGNVWDSVTKSQNNVYVLDENLEVIGRLEGLAPGESIYSVRFMGERGYVVTFKKVDPLFVIDLSNPEEPDVLGKLKIPGYSDYLHPYDENHIIGIGKEAVDAESELVESRGLDFAWYQGVKIAIFDVSDVENPIELHKIVIGDRGTDSPVLHDHKAFLFDRERELMVLPITLAEIEDKTGEPTQYGEYVYQGAYVYRVNLEDGFKLKGRITHYDEDEIAKKSGFYPYSGDRNVERSLYMDDVLYTFSQSIIKANDLNDLEELNYVELPYEGGYYREYY